MRCKMVQAKPNKEEVQRVREIFSKEEMKLIQKESPFRRLRNEGIRRLCAMGVKMTIIEKITGLSDSAIAEIRDGKQKY